VVGISVDISTIIAIARMMLTCIYHMIQTGEAFNPSDYEEFNKSTPRKVVLNDENAFLL
jgi:hypothetical protein